MAIIIMWGCVIGLAYFLRYVGEKPFWWRNTLFSFPAGMMLSFFHEPVKKWMDKCGIYAVLIGAVFVVTAILWFNSVNPRKMWITNICAILMGYGVPLLFSHTDFRKKPRIFIWFGSMLFSIYIFQRAPMMVLSKLKWLTNSAEYFIPATVLLSLLIGILMHQVFKLVDKYCFRKS